MKPAELIKKFGNVAVNLMIVSGCAVMVFSLLGFLGGYNAILDLFAHFRLQFGLYLMFVALLVFKRKWLCATLGIVAAYNLILVGMIYIPTPSDGATVSGANHALTLLDMNINFQNQKPSLVNREIETISADVVVIEELTAPLFQSLQPALAAYPYRVISLRSDPMGIGIFSKQKFLSSDDNTLKSPIPLAISAVIQPGDKPMEIIGIHFLPPLRNEYSEINKGIAELVGKTAHKFTGPVLVVGDFNATPWSALFTRLVKASGLRDSESGFGAQPSWPCIDPLLDPLVQIPIDHCLISSDCRVAQRSIGSEIGSDHKPVILKLMVP